MGAFFARKFFLSNKQTKQINELQYLNGLAQLSRTVEIRPVVTNHVRFLDKNDFIVHEARVCIQQGVTLEDKKRIKSFSHEQHFCSSNQMKKI